jgi:hypothetical protein
MHTGGFNLKNSWIAVTLPDLMGRGQIVRQMHLLT